MHTYVCVNFRRVLGRIRRSSDTGGVSLVGFPRFEFECPSGPTPLLCSRSRGKTTSSTCPQSVVTLLWHKGELYRGSSGGSSPQVREVGRGSRGHPVLPGGPQAPFPSLGNRIFVVSSTPQDSGHHHEVRLPYRPVTCVGLDLPRSVITHSGSSGPGVDTKVGVEGGAR